MAGYYINAEVRKMYGIPLSQLTPEQRRILKADGERRKKLIEAVSYTHLTLPTNSRV